MARARIRWNIPAFEKIRRLDGVDDELRKRVDSVLDTVGREHYDGGVERGRTRSRGYVVTKDFEGILDHSRNASLLRALAREQEVGDA